LEDMEARWLSGHPLDVPAYAALTNVVSRSLRILGLQRRPRDVTPDLTSYIDAQASEPAVPGKRGASDRPDQPPRPPRPPNASAMTKRKRTEPDELAGQDELPLSILPPPPC
jgi:hypothetical protein